MGGLAGGDPGRHAKKAGDSSARRCQPNMRLGKCKSIHWSTLSRIEGTYRTVEGNSGRITVSHAQVGNLLVLPACRVPGSVSQRKRSRVGDGTDPYRTRLVDVPTALPGESGWRRGLERPRKEKQGHCCPESLYQLMLCQLVTARLLPDVKP
jgi:hypothetical protein